MKFRWIYLVITLIVALGMNTSTATAESSGTGSIEQFDLVSETTGWLLSEHNLYWTTDSGKHWSVITPSGVAQANIHAVYFLDTSSGWAVVSDAGKLTLAATHDAGQSWSQSPLRLFSPGDPSAAASAYWLQFVDVHTGWLVIKQATSSNFSIGTLFRTLDGGQSWTQLALPVGEPVYFQDAQNGWTVGGAAKAGLYRTRDGGVSWQTETLGAALTPQSYQLPVFVGNDGVLPVLTGIGEDTTLALYRTSDAGNTWTLSRSLPVGETYGPGVRVPLAVLPGHEDVIVALPGRAVQTISLSEVTKATLLPNAPGGVTVLRMRPYGHGMAQTVNSTCNRKVCSTTTHLFYTPDGGNTWAPVPLPDPASSAGIPDLSAIGSGQGIDMCSIASANQLQAWWTSSPFSSINLYMGGSNRGCLNANLTAPFLRTLNQQGWRFIPTWVGPQGGGNTCGCGTLSSDPMTAYNQGVSEANAASDAASALGLGPTMIYYDMENYATSNSTYRAAVNAFVSGWDVQLRARGNQSGVYGASCATAVTDFASIANVPDAMWIANWFYNSGSGDYNPNASVYGLSCVSNSLWSNHQRLRQYAGGLNQTWGGITLNVDLNVIDGPLAFLEAPYNTNLIRNGDFASGLTSWSLYQSSASVNGSGQLVLGPAGSVYQPTGYAISPGNVLQLTFYAGNTSASDQTLSTVMHAASDWNNAILCNFTIPANSSPAFYTVRGKVATPWTNYQIEFAPNGGSGVILDNVTLWARSDIASFISQQECAPFPRSNTELLRDQSFTGISTAAATAWQVWGDTTYSVQGGVVTLATLPNGANHGASLVQVVNRTVDGLNVEASVQIGNPNPAAKVVRISLMRFVYQNAATDIAQCYFTLPANSPLSVYTLQASLSHTWENTQFHIMPYIVDGSTYTVAAPSYRYVPALALNAGEVRCLTPVGPTATPTATTTSTPRPPRPDTAGVYKDGVFYLRNTNSAGPADITVAFGGDSSDLPVAGDWNGDGLDTIGVYRSSLGVYYLSDSNVAPSVTYSLVFGNPGDTPFAGRWLVSMTSDGVGVYRNSNGILYERISLTSGVSNYFAIYGNPGDRGFAGDWDGDGLDSIGVYRASNTTWYLTNNSQPTGVTFSAISFAWNIGANWSVVGDWDGNLTSTSAAYDPVNSIFALSNVNAQPGTLNTFSFGPTGGNAYPISGKWTLGTSLSASAVIGGYTDSGMDSRGD